MKKLILLAVLLPCLALGQVKNEFCSIENELSDCTNYPYTCDFNCATNPQHCTSLIAIIRSLGIGYQTIYVKSINSSFVEINKKNRTIWQQKLKIQRLERKLKKLS
jgi:hypothetical protein